MKAIPLVVVVIFLLLTESERRNYPVSVITDFLWKKVGEVPVSQTSRIPIPGVRKS